MVSPFGSIKYGSSFLGQMKEYPLCLHLYPTDSTAGVFGKMYGLASSLSCSTKIGSCFVALIFPFAVPNFI